MRADGVVDAGGRAEERAAVLACQRGELAAFARLVRLHQEIALRTAYLLTNDRQGAEDVAQVAFLQAFRAINRCDPERPFRPWLLGIVANEARMYRRGRARRPAERLNGSIAATGNHPWTRRCALRWRSLMSRCGRRRCCTTSTTRAAALCGGAVGSGAAARLGGIWVIETGDWRIAEHWQSGEMVEGLLLADGEQCLLVQGIERLRVLDIGNGRFAAELAGPAALVTSLGELNREQFGRAKGCGLGHPPQWVVGLRRLGLRRSAMTMRRRTFWRAGLVFCASGLAACSGEDAPPATIAPTAGASASASARPAETAIPAVASPRSAASPVVGGAATPPQCSLTPSMNGTGVSQIGTPPVRSSVGQGHVLSGTVRSLRDCAPLAGATLIFWLAGPDGKYAPAYEATMHTDASGAYRFESTYPGSYEGTRPHIHMFVSAGGHYGIETVYQPPSGSQLGTYDIVLAVK